ncbi:MAG: SDR family oxidoreductase [Candidatus Acidiferrales bacterium]|nr:SDR family oxidoreductase [Acidobacteriota bacterium]MCH8947194.1 SDR family oxidoreductase [Acidobacteriota bacterium]
MKLSNQVAVITGASEGIGAAIARRFAGEGARVVLAARSEEKLKALAEELGSERALAVPTDVTDAEQVKRLMARTREHFGGLDILVNNAGVGLYASVAEMAWADFEQMWKVNFFGVVRCIREALPDLRERRGMVVNISSVAGKLAIPYLTGYCASKFALNAFSTGLRMELAQAGVRVVVVCPGTVRTPFHQSAFRSNRLPEVFAQRSRGGISAERVAAATLRAVVRGRREVVVPWRLRLAVGFRNLLPAFADGILQRMLR